MTCMLVDIRDVQRAAARMDACRAPSTARAVCLNFDRSGKSVSQGHVRAGQSVRCFCAAWCAAGNARNRRSNAMKPKPVSPISAGGFECLEKVRRAGRDDDASSRDVSIVQLQSSSD